MRTQSQKKIEKAQQLFEIIEARRKLERQETDLKEYFKDLIEDGVLIAGDVQVIVEPRERVTLDRDRLEAKFGDLEKFERTTEFLQVSVVRA